MLEMSVVRGVGGVCDIGTWEKLDMCLCFGCGGVGGVGGEWVGGLGGWVCVMSVCSDSESILNGTINANEIGYISANQIFYSSLS